MTMMGRRPRHTQVLPAVERYRRILRMVEANMTIPQMQRAEGGLSRARIYQLIKRATEAREQGYLS